MLKTFLEPYNFCGSLNLHGFWKSVKSTKSDHAIRYHSLHSNVYIRHFSGHTDKVTTLEMSPIEDQFLSCSLDRFEKS